MSWRRVPIIRAVVAASAIVAAWAGYEPAVAGPYRWTDWRDLRLNRPPTVDDPSPGLTPRAASLAGTAVFLVAQKDVWAGGGDGKFWPTVHVPACGDAEAAAVTLGVRTGDRAAFDGDDANGLVRVWGRLRTTAAGGRALPAGYGAEVPLQLDVDRYELDPPFLPAGIAPTTPAEWAGWATAAGLAAAAAGPAVRGCRRLARVRAVALGTGAGLLLAAVVVFGAWAFVPGVAELNLHVRRSTWEAAAGRSGFFVHWTSDDGDGSGFRRYAYGKWPEQSAGPLGLAVHTYYTRYDWGNVHAHVDLTVSPAVLAGTLGLLSTLAFRVGRRAKPTPGRCGRCGYDLRATPDRFPEWGRVNGPTQRS